MVVVEACAATVVVVVEPCGAAVAVVVDGWTAGIVVVIGAAVVTDDSVVAWHVKVGPDFWPSTRNDALPLLIVPISAMSYRLSVPALRPSADSLTSSMRPHCPCIST